MKAKLKLPPLPAPAPALAAGIIEPPNPGIARGGAGNAPTPPNGWMGPRGMPGTGAAWTGTAITNGTGRGNILGERRWRSKGDDSLVAATANVTIANSIFSLEKKTLVFNLIYKHKIIVVSNEYLRSRRFL